MYSVYVVCYAHFYMRNMLHLQLISLNLNQITKPKLFNADKKNNTDYSVAGQATQVYVFFFSYSFAVIPSGFLFFPFLRLFVSATAQPNWMA